MAAMAITGVHVLLYTPEPAVQLYEPRHRTAI
jgi:hypothetical protein